MLNVFLLSHSNRIERGNMKTCSGTINSQYLLITVEIDIKKILQTVLQTIENEVRMEIPPFFGSVVLNRKGILHHTPNAV